MVSADVNLTMLVKTARCVLQATTSTLIVFRATVTCMVLWENLVIKRRGSVIVFLTSRGLCVTDVRRAYITIQTVKNVTAILLVPRRFLATHWEDVVK